MLWTVEKKIVKNDSKHLSRTGNEHLKMLTETTMVENGQCTNSHVHKFHNMSITNLVDFFNQAIMTS